MRERFNRTVCWLARRFGQKIVDARTGESVGRAFMLCFRGRVRLIGLRTPRSLYPAFKTELRTTYWRREIEFRSHPDPDFPDESPDP